MNPAPIKPLISTSDLDKIDVRGGTILAVEDLAHSEKLVRLRVDFGDHARSILVGMKKWRPYPKGVDRRLVCPPFRRPILIPLWID
jgi:tRNA-binding EMAP/Myf-like protein